MQFTAFLKVIFIFSLFTNLSAENLKKVTLQLSLFDQFQFAGYYIAKEKGFYKDIGLDVEIKPFQFGLDIPQLVSDGNIDFAVGRETLILDRINDKKIVALYSLFQSTPLILISTKKSGINSIENFKNKKVMTTIDDSSEVSLKAMITSHKVRLQDITFLMHTHNINDLINGNTDVISAYTSKAPFELKKKGIEFNVFDPKKFGFDMYSDFLFTSEKLISSDQKMVEEFKAASLKGWEYAYRNINEATDLILKKYNSQFLSKDELIFEGNELKKLSYFDTLNLGEIKKEKVQRIYDLYNIMGLVPKSIDLNKFVYDTYFEDQNSNEILKKYENYILENRVVKTCVIPNSEPYSYIDNGELKGFASDYLKLIQNKTKLNFTLVHTQNLAQSVEFLKEKRCDVLLSAEATKDRMEFANFTEPYLDIPLGLITNSNYSFVDNISVLKGKKIGLVKSYSANKKIKDAYPELTFVDVNSLDEGIQKVLDGTLDGHIDALYPSWYQIYVNDLTKLRISAKLDITIPISIAVENDDKTLYDIINTAVKQVDKKEIAVMLKKWVTIDYKKETDYSIIYKILFVVFIIILAFLYRQKVLRNVNYDLKKELEEKNIELTRINNELEQRVRKEVEENLKKDRILAQQSKMVAMGQMIENIAHQWRQPLSLITTVSSGMKLKNQLDCLDKESLVTSIDTIIDTSNYLSNTIDDFRFFFEPKKEKDIFSLSKCCQKTINLLKPTFAIKDIDIILNYEKKILLNGYERELIQVLINILNNSKDALLLNDVSEKLIFIDIYELKDKIFIEIKDNGNGMAEDILEKIYEPYFTTKHNAQGTGIGLYMCQEIITKHMEGKIYTKNTKFTYDGKKYKGAITSIILNKN